MMALFLLVLFGLLLRQIELLVGLVCLMACTLQAPASFNMLLSPSDSGRVSHQMYRSSLEKVLVNMCLNWI